MSINITKEVISRLSKNQLFKLFFDYHFETIDIRTLIPSYRKDGSIYFPVKTIIKEKDIGSNTQEKFIKEYRELMREKE